MLSAQLYAVHMPTSAAATVLKQKRECSTLHVQYHQPPMLTLFQKFCIDKLSTSSSCTYIASILLDAWII